MTSLVKALARTGKATSGLVAGILILVGCLLTIGGYVYRVFEHPEWTFDEATLALWPFFSLGAVSLALGWLVDRTEASPRAARVRRSETDA